MPIVRIELFSGRTTETKAAIAEGITRLLETTAGIPAKDTTILFFDVEKTDWAVAGKLDAPVSDASDGTADT